MSVSLILDAVTTIVSSPLESSAEAAQTAPGAKQAALNINAKYLVIFFTSPRIYFGFALCFDIKAV